jgi:hypothetical protein
MTLARLEEHRELVSNLSNISRQWLSSQVDPRRNLYDECGYPGDPSTSPNSGLSTDLYRSLYDREPIATRVVELMAKECWQQTPTIFEDMDSTTVTPFEEAIDNLGAQLRGENCWYQDEVGSPIWEKLQRVDILSGIGHFGILLLGIDDGKNLQEPIDGVMVTNDGPLTRDEEKALSNPQPRWKGQENFTVNQNGQGRGIPTSGDRLGAQALNDYEKTIINQWVQERERNWVLNASGMYDQRRATRDRGFHVPGNEPSRTRAKPLDPTKGDPLHTGDPQEVFGTDRQYDDLGYGLGMPPPASALGYSLSGTDEQYFGVQFGPSEMPAPPTEPGMYADDPQSLKARTGKPRKQMQGDNPTQVQPPTSVPQSSVTPPSQHLQPSAVPFPEEDNGAVDAIGSDDDDHLSMLDAELSQTGNQPQLLLAEDVLEDVDAEDVNPLDQSAPVAEDELRYEDAVEPEEVAAQPVKRRPRLLFLRPYDESQCQIVRYEWNIRNPRFGMPVMYRVTLNDPRESHGGVGLPLATVFVHWSRVIHVAETSRAGGTSSSEIFAVPKLRPVLNPILDIQKIRGAGAEGYWKSCFAGLAFETHAQLGGDVFVDETATRDTMENYWNGLQRGLIGKGGSWKTLAPSVTDPTPQINVNIEAICICLGCPVPVFKGYEIGEQASTNNAVEWNKRKYERQNNFITPKIIVPLIDRLIQVGVLPAPGNARSRVENVKRTQPWTKIQRVERGWLILNYRKQVNNVVSPSVSDEQSRRNMPKAFQRDNQQDPRGMKDRQAMTGQAGGDDAFSQGNVTGVYQNQGDAAAHGPAYSKQSFGATQQGGYAPPTASSDAAGGAMPWETGMTGTMPVQGTGSNIFVSDGGYSIEWPDVEALSKQAKATVATTLTTALAAYIQAGGPQYITFHRYLVDIWGWTDEQAKSAIDEVQHEQEAAQAEQMDAQQAGMVPPTIGSDGQPLPPDPNQLPMTEQPPASSGEQPLPSQPQPFEKSNQPQSDPENPVIESDTMEDEQLPLDAFQQALQRAQEQAKAKQFAEQ